MGDMSVSYYIIKPAEIARAVSVFIFVSPTEHLAGDIVKHFLNIF